MANSITLKTATHGSRYLQLVCTQKSNGSEKNSSTITWTLSAIGDSTDYSTGPTTVVIGGKTVYNKERVAWSDGFPAVKGSTSGTITVQHDSDGTKSVDVKLSTAIYTKTVSSYSDTWELDSIPRYGTSVQSVASKEETTITMNWSSDSVADYLWYSINNGSSWTGVNIADGKSGTYKISGLAANTTYKVKTRLRRKDSQLTKDSTALDVTTYDYPYCTESPNFVIGDTVQLKFYNPLRRELTFNIIANGVKLTYDWTAEGTTYTGLYADGVQTQLYNSIPNAKSGQYQVVVTYGGSVRTRNNGNTYTVNTSVCAPSLTDFYCIDTNEYTRSTADFYFALENAGFERLLINRKRYFKGLKLKADDEVHEDFLN